MFTTPSAVRIAALLAMIGLAGCQTTELQRTTEQQRSSVPCNHRSMEAYTLEELVKIVETGILPHCYKPVAQSAYSDVKNLLAKKLNEASGMQTTRDAFKSALHKEYVALAVAEQRRGDARDAIFFIKRAEEVGLGLDVSPQPMADRKIPKYAKKGIANARATLVAKLWNGADELTPKAAAKAQAGFDCWLEEVEEDDNADGIRACRQAFTAALFDMKTHSNPKATKKAQTVTTKKRSLENAKKECTSIGLKTGTEVFGNCVMKLMD